ncbi:hypothetical protein EUTSA_v10006911mg [Eutrema salsugineum]|uniref:SWIM-type domain-containing protein n=1 Tax=Eutrema salsugineum TaxID=72664 RepID=V4L8Z0_EUTSA|nr:uncharacterized protein LOC18994199 [Eutrema salsugineum]ESQ36238.1 hypothetical protein EUTSA_v10006911mg [Eutrema salsugineum]
MANDELVKPENCDSSFRQDHFTGIRHNYELFPSHDYTSGFEQLLDINLQIGVSSYQENEVWNHFQEHKVMAIQDSRINHNNDETNQAFGLDGNQNDDFLSFPDDDDSGTSEIDKSTVVEAKGASQKQESQEISDDLELGVSHSMDFSRKPEKAPPSPQCWSIPGAGPEHEMAVGMEFSDVNACRRALRNAAISLRFEMHTIKSDKTRFTAKCMGEGCPWRIHCAKLPNVPTFTIRTIHGSHTCGGISHLGHQQASVQWVAEVVAEKLKENPHFKPKEILEEIHRVHGIALSYKQAWRGKERIMATLHGSFEEEYRLLPQYCDEIRRTNPGSIAVVHADPTDERFQQLFICFRASISGFLNACRPLIALDKTLLKSKYPGTLLLATGFDGDGAVLPLAFAIVNEENDSNWHQFLSELRKVLEANSESMPKLTILSTREKSIADGVESNFPTATHGFCVHYLTERFQREFQNSTLVNLLWEAAHSLTVLEFTSKMNKIEQISPKAFLWIQDYSPSLWASPYFEGTRYGHLTANVVTQSLNNWIEDASGLPIIQMMECIHRHLMNLFKERREKSSQWSDVLVPSAERQLLAAIEQSRVHRVYRANEAEFEVMTLEANVVVDIENRTCLCGRWQIYGLPCSHAVAALLSCKEDVYVYTEKCFTVENYRRTYADTVEPVSDEVVWKEKDSERDDGIRTPRVIRVAPRRRRVRAEDRGRVKRVVHCSLCNQTGHFRTTCTAAPM